MAMSAEYIQTVKPITGNGDVFKWLKNVTVGRNNTNKTNGIAYRHMCDQWLPSTA